MTDRKKAFTLLELLLAVAIISLLAALIVVYLLPVKKRGLDGSIIAHLTQVRKEAALIQNQDGSYQNLCLGGTLNEGNLNLKEIEDEVMKRNGGRPVYCYASGEQFCVQTALASGGDFCVDYLGRATSLDTNCSDSNKKCVLP